MAEKPQLKKLDNCKRKIDIIVPAQKAAQELEEVYAAIAKTAQIPGFRVGKVPRDILEKHYGASAKEEALRRLIPEAYRQSVEELGIIPLTMPEISDVKMELGQTLSYSATVDVKPEVKLKSYKGLKIKKTVKEVKPEEVSQVLETLRERGSEFVDVQGRGVAMGDYVICDLEAVCEGKTIEKRQKAWIFMDEKFTIPGFCQGLIGAMSEEKKKIETSFPQEYPEKQYAGKPVVFDVLVSLIKEKKLPALDDEFAKDLGAYQNMDELKKEIEKDIKARHERETKLEMENQILEQILKAHIFDLPETIVEAQKKRIVEDYKHDLKHKGVSEDAMKSKEADILKSAAEKADRDVKVYFILEKIAETENIKIKPEELDERVGKIADYSKKTPEDIKKYLEEKDMLDDLIVEMREDKVMDFLIENSKIEESKE